MSEIPRELCLAENNMHSYIAEQTTCAWAYDKDRDLKVGEVRSMARIGMPSAPINCHSAPFLLARGLKADVSGGMGLP